ncbi:MAG TPA: FAD-binding oxidoreductase [Steroidobacteraceae bacterium]|nr:FAD-binding oxidoreductase [Steroidobacteraceae bacterium]
MRDRYEFVVVGGGIVGASVAYHLAPHGRVCVLEQESAAGYHSTGRSAALFTENYGTAAIRRLTALGRPFLESPPAGFAAHALLVPRGMMYIGGREDGDALTRLLDEGRAVAAGIHAISQEEVLELCPVLRADVAAAGVFEPQAMDMDVDAILQGFLRGLRRRGGVVAVNTALERIERVGSNWQLVANGRSMEAPVIVNAAGAWCDVVARLAGLAPIGLVAKRRTAITIDPPPGIDIQRWPMVYHVNESFYIKPEAGRILASPVDATATAPGDTQPDEYDVALIADRLERATTLKVDRIHRKWAGLRSFVDDGDPVIGEDPAAPGFFWAAALGGYGVMTSPAVGALCASLIVSGAAALEPEIDARFLGPARLRR